MLGNFFTCSWKLEHVPTNCGRQICSCFLFHIPIPKINHAGVIQCLVDDLGKARVTTAIGQNGQNLVSLLQLAVFDTDLARRAYSTECQILFELRSNLKDLCFLENILFLLLELITVYMVVPIHAKHCRKLQVDTVFALKALECNKNHNGKAIITDC